MLGGKLVSGQASGRVPERSRIDQGLGWNDDGNGNPARIVTLGLDGDWFGSRECRAWTEGFPVTTGKCNAGLGSESLTYEIWMLVNVAGALRKKKRSPGLSVSVSFVE
jgi:hypothetical protein